LYWKSAIRARSPEKEGPTPSTVVSCFRAASLSRTRRYSDKSRQQATFYTDHYAASTGVIPPEQPRAITKHPRKTNHIERFNHKLR
jgi:hypothetical protein